MWLILLAIIIIIVGVFLLYMYMKNDQNVILSTTTNKIKLTWNAMSDATSYKIKVGKVSKVYDKEYISNTNSFELDRDACRAYYIVVNTVSSTCISPDSDEVSVGKLDNAPKITNVDNLLLTWTSSDAKLFTIYVNEKEVARIAGTLRQYKITDVTCGVQNIVKVKADLDGCSSTSEGFPFTLKTPDKPSNIKIID